jgi:deoxyadenosine/deoxycytidine kinase
MIEMGSISSTEWEAYNKEFFQLKDSLEDIDLFILLKCELQENINRIKKRGRSYDEAKDTSYLISLEQKYHQFQKFVKTQMPKCRVLEIDTTCMTPVEVLHLLENYIFSKFVSDMQPRTLKGKFGIKC